MRSEERILEFKVGASPACSAWDPTDQFNLAVISKDTNETYLLRKGDRGTGGFRKGYSRRYSCLLHYMRAMSPGSFFSTRVVEIVAVDDRFGLNAMGT